MRKNKGYQKDYKKSWHSKQSYNSFAGGRNKTLEQYMGDISKEFDNRIKKAKESYTRISNLTSLTGKDLMDYCRELSMWEVRFDENFNLIPLEEVIAQLEELRDRMASKYSYGYERRTVHKDNQKFVYNSTGGGDNCHKVRIPSMKRSKATWKRFYELFPFYKEHYAEWNNKNGIKLKKVW